MSLSHVFDSLLRMLGMRTLNQQFLFSYALMFLLAVTASVALYLSMSVSPETINVAGAQRMLSQKMTKEALLLRQGASERKSLEPPSRSSTRPTVTCWPATRHAISA